MYRYLISTIILFSLALTSFSQSDGFKSKFEEANVLMDDHYYILALPVWRKLLREDPTNSNVAYKIGLCYFNLPTEEAKGLKYFKIAVKDISSNYNPFMYSERGANPEALYYLGHVFHVDYQLDSATFYFNKFIETVNKKHLLHDKAIRQIEMCKNAKELMDNPVPIIITNLGSQINSSASEHSPILSLDESEIFFTSRRLRADSSNRRFKDLHDGHYFEDVYVSYKDDSGEWQEPELLNLNRPTKHLATIALSPDYQTLYLYKDDDGDGNIYYSQLLGDQWSVPELMGSDINSKEHETHITVSSDGKTLYYASDKKGGFGGFDIYQCNKLPNGKWGKSIHLGAPINTQYDDEGPFLHADNKTMYFSSKGHNSMGGYDIFYSEQQTDGTWSEPVNLGYPINSTHDDVFYVSSPDGKRGYYSSYGITAEGYGEKDIYMIEREGASEKKLTLLKGYVRVEEGQQLPENIVVNLTDNETGKLVAQGKPSRRTGGFVFIIPPGKNYNLTYEANGVEFYNENIYVPMGSEYREIDKEILLDPVDLTAREIQKTTEGAIKWKFQYKKLDKALPIGLTISYIDEDGNMLYTEPVAKDGTFKFHTLPGNQNGFFRINAKDATMCNGAEIALLNSDFKVEFAPDGSCEFKEKPAPKSDTKYLVQNVGNPKAEIPSGVTVIYKDSKNNTIKSAEVDANGNFNYYPLPSDYSTFELQSNNELDCKSYKIVEIKESGEIISEYVDDEDCLYRKSDVEPKLEETKEIIAKISLTTLPIDAAKGLKVNYLDDNGNVLFTETIDEKGYFTYHKLDNGKTPKLQLLSEDATLCNETELFFAYKANESDVLVNYQLGEDCSFIPVVIEKLMFEEFFTYNKNEVKNQKEFSRFINSVAENINKTGKAKISIESSASRVPTKTHGTNEKLAKLRANNAKENVLEALKNKGVDASKVSFVSISTEVQGPKYKGDYATNRATYEKYQFVKIFSE